LTAKNDVVMTISKGGLAQISLDAGKTWTQATLPDAFAQANKVAITAKKLIIATTNEIYGSSDNGKTWKVDYAASGVNLFTTLGGVVYGATSKGVLVYNETTNAWEQVGLVGKTVNYIFSDNKNLYADESKNNVYTKYRSVDKGKTWTVITGFDVPRNMASSGITSYAGGVGMGVYNSKDNGLTWSGSLFGTPSDDVNDMVAIDDSLFVSYAGATFQPALGLYKYNTKDDTWATRNNGLTDKNLVKLAYNGNGTLWAMQQNTTGFDGAMYKIGIGKKSNGVGISDILLNNNFVMLSPNPSNNIINIKLLDNKTLTSLDIFDIQGKRVQNLEATNTLQIDVRSFPKGTYILKCNFSNEYTVNKFEVE
jgi:hypothetical protein